MILTTTEGSLVQGKGVGLDVSYKPEIFLCLRLPVWFLCRGQEELAWWAVHAPPGADLCSGFFCSSNLTVILLLCLHDGFSAYASRILGVADMRQTSDKLSEPQLVSIPLAP